MNTQKLKAKQAERRRYRVRKIIYGTPAKPRLSVSRSNLHISAQLIDDLNGVTLAAATSQGKSSGLKHGGNVKAAAEVGKRLAEAAKAKGITVAAFDRGPFRFHGRIAALAVAWIVVSSSAASAFVCGPGRYSDAQGLCMDCSAGRFQPGSDEPAGLPAGSSCDPGMSQPVIATRVTEREIESDAPYWSEIRQLVASR